MLFDTERINYIIIDKMFECEPDELYFQKREYNELKTYKQANACLRECQNNHKNEYWFYQDEVFLIIVFYHDKCFFINYGINLSLGINYASKNK